MKFAHIADCHLGCWRQPEMQALNLEAFERAIDRCISEKVDFVLLVGDLFDTALPSIDVLKSAASKLRELKDKAIACYIIHGSHDFSVSGKSMISVLEKAGLCEDIADKFVETNNTVLFGFAGKKGGLEQQDIIEQKKTISEKIKQIKNNKADKSAILLAHTTILELTNLPEQVDSISLKDLPEGFDYYALGHIHQKKISSKNEKTIAYSGALFPVNFSELEEQHKSSFFIIEKSDLNNNLQVEQISDLIKPVLNIVIDANGESPLTIKEKILAEFDKNKEQFKNSVVTLRIAGELETGRPSAVDFHLIEEQAKQLGVYCLLRNLSKFTSKEFELKIGGLETFGAELTELKDINELEKFSLKTAIKENVISGEKEQLAQQLMQHLVLEKQEGETVSTFNSRLAKNIIKILGIEGDWE